jgi:mannose-6-phosphate isomerase-like protein (cupin superfamily)
MAALSALHSRNPETAPDGSTVWPLARCDAGSLARFELAAGQTSKAVMHRTIQEIWYVQSGRGTLWRACGSRQEILVLTPGVSLTLTAGTAFQFRAGDSAPLVILAVSMPPWPGDGEALEVPGKWLATVG